MCLARSAPAQEAIRGIHSACSVAGAIQPKWLLPHGNTPWDAMPVEAVVSGLIACTTVLLRALSAWTLTQRAEASDLDEE